MTSTVPAFKSALKTRLASSLASLAEVYYGAASPNKMGAKVLLIGPAKNRTLEFVAGMSQANESYDVEVIASVIGPVQETHEALAALAYGIIDGTISSVLSWAALPSGVNNIIPGESEDEEAVGDGFREAYVKQTLHVQARI
jgi:hypothetical protein